MNFISGVLMVIAPFLFVIVAIAGALSVALLGAWLRVRRGD